MFDWLYQLPTSAIAVIVVVVTASVGVGGFQLACRFLLPCLKLHEGVNDAISGALGAIGVFYGITVGLIAIDVWQRHSNAQEIAAREASTIQILYLLVESEIGTPVVPELEKGAKRDENESLTPGQLVSNYLQAVICVAWDEQRYGKTPREDWIALRALRKKIMQIEPAKEGEKARYAATIQSLNDLSEQRRLRVDATNDRLSGVMWMIILCGAALTMSVVYLFKLEDTKLHLLVVGLLSGFLGLVFLMIIVNDRPFVGPAGIQPSSYTEVGWLMKKGGSNPFQPLSLHEACQGLRRQ